MSLILTLGMIWGGMGLVISAAIVACLILNARRTQPSPDGQLSVQVLGKPETRLALAS